MLQSNWMFECPLCPIKEKCNTRHLHTLCQHPIIHKLRHDLLLQIEHTLELLFECADTMHRTLGLHQSYTLYSSLFRALQHTELQLPLARGKSDTVYRQNNQQIISIPQWSLATKSQLFDPSIVHAYPLALSLGLTGRFSTSSTAQDSMTNEEESPITSPVDKMYLGLLPSSFHEAINNFMRTTNSPITQDLRNHLIQHWKALQSLLMLKPIIIQRAIRGILMRNKKTYVKYQHETFPPSTSKSNTTMPTNTNTNSSTTSTPIMTKVISQKCTGSRCQQRLLICKTPAEWTPNKSRICSFCTIENQGWKLAKQVESTILSTPKRKRQPLTDFVDSNYNQKVTIQAIWDVLQPYFSSNVQ